MNTKICSVIMISLFSVMCLTGCGKEIATEPAAVQYTDDTVDDGISCDVVMTEEFTEIFSRIEGEWLSEDGNNAFSFFKDGEDYWANVLEYKPDHTSVSKDDGTLFSIMYDTRSDCAENEDVVSLDFNADIMQMEVEIYLDKDNGYIKKRYQDSVKYYPYDGKLPVEEYLQSRLMARTIIDSCPELSCDVDILEKTCCELVAADIWSIYPQHANITQQNDDSIVIRANAFSYAIGKRGGDLNIEVTIKPSGELIEWKED